MSTQQDIYAAGSKNCPPMLNKENYVPWSSRLLWYAKSRPNGNLIHNSIINGPYVRQMILKPGDSNRDVLVNEIFHVQTNNELSEKELKQIEADDQAIQTILLGLPEDIYAAVDNDLKAKQLARTQDPLALMATSNNPYTFSVLHQDQPSFNQNYMQQPMLNLEDITDPTTTMNMALALMAKLQMVGGNGGNQFRQYAGQNVGNLNGYNDFQNVGNQVIQHAVQNLRIQNVGNQNGLIGIPWNANQNPNGNGNLVAARAEGNATGHNRNQIRCYNYRGVGYFARNCTVRPRRRDAAYLQTQLLIAQKEEAGIQLQAKEFDLMAVAADLDEIEKVNANCILMANLQQASTSGTQTDKALVYDSDGSAKVHNYKDCYDNEIFNMFTQEEQYTELLELILEPHQVSQNDNDIISEDSSVEQSGGIIEHHPANVKETRVLYDSLYNNLAIEVEKVNTGRNHVPNKVRASIRTKPFTISQPPVITKKVVNSDSNGLSSTRVDNTKTRRPQSRSNTKNDRVPSASKSSRSETKEVEVEEHHRKLLLFRNKKHMSSECNNVKLATQNVNSKVVCAMCKQCLNSVNNDVCLLNYMNGMIARGKKQKANVSINEKQKKHQPKVKKTKKVGSIERLASPKPSKPRSFLRWSPTGRLFDLKGKIITSSKSESQSDCSKGDNACASNPLEHTIKRFPNSTFSLAGTVCFGNDHVATILGFDDLQWGNILITRVYFVEGLGDRTTNLYNIKLHQMAYTSPICLMARASSTKSWLWHQCLSHLNFDTVNDLAKNDLVSCLPKFKYHKEHLCPSCEQGKSEKASHPPKPVPNSRQRLHLLHMDLCGPMRIASINEKRYVLVIVDDYTRYTWVHFLRSKDEAPEVIKTFLNRITILLQSPVIIIRTDNDTKFKNQVLKEYFDSVGISHQMSSVRTPQQNGVVERRNRTLVHAARTMLICSCDPLFLWAKAIATACFTQNRSIIHRRFNKTPYELINGKKPDISFLHVFGALCYPKNDHENIRKLGVKGDIGFFIGYSADSCAYRVYNRRTKKIMETMNVLIPDPDNITPLTLKWLFKNKHDEEKTVIQNKSRLVMRGYRQEEEIDFEESFAKLFSDLMKSRFEMSMMGEMTFFLGLQVNQSPCGIFINQSNYVLEILKKYGMESCDPVGTPMEIKDKLNLEQNGTPVDATKYHSMIVALMYLTSSKPDIVHATCLCARYQAKPTEKHLKEVKRIFRYLSGTVNTGLWYTKDSGFELTGFLDADYAGYLFTKALPVDRFNYLVRRLGMRSLSPQELDRLVKSHQSQRDLPRNTPLDRVEVLGTVQFGEDHMAKILGYGDYQIGNVTISRVYYMEGLGHNLFFVRQFCDLNLEVAFRQHTCFIRNLKGVDLLIGSQGNNMYTMSLRDMMPSSLICLLSKASKTKSWIWHQRLSHLNFGTITHLARHGLVQGLPKLKFEKEHLCSTCLMGKSKKKPYKLKSEDTNQEKLYLLHMDLCGPMRVASVNAKKYILVIIDDYSRFTWVKCLRHNRTLIEATYTMLIYEKAPLFLWSEAVATACYTQNRSIIRLRHGKTPYELLPDKLPDLSFFHVFGALCYLTNDRENLGTVQFGEDHMAKILGYGDYQIGNVTISRVYYMEGLGHNLFFVRKFCDSKFEVTFRQHTCFIRNLKGVDLLIGSRGNNLYTMSLRDMMPSSLICLLSNASKTKSWIWHRRLSHLNFGTITHLARHGLVRVLLKVPVQFTWVKCLRSKDEAPNFIIKFLKMIQVRLKVPVRRIKTDNGTEFVNQTLLEYYEKVGISHETSFARSLQQNGVVERHNRTLIEATYTMLIYEKAHLFLWAEAVATACYTQNHSIIRLRHGKTPYELLHDKLPGLSFFHVFGALCYLTNDRENMGNVSLSLKYVDKHEITLVHK
uniref:Retrovirus-related Pol polyprotein from transposon TNT 1-94 n=1 Tax=Tanacetum cinerariifolium TaxID=118510 RepID=A0A6L2N1J5_TANCI|nr:retrovirus-related Pol polyprotein from transposon TNT 1-94 [Tanacetum cinerariifolium]